MRKAEACERFFTQTGENATYPLYRAPWVATTTLTAGDVGSVAFLESGSTGGFVLLTGETTGGYDAWRSASGASWTNVESIDEDVVDLAVWERRALVLTADGSILELQPGDTWAGFADAMNAWPEIRSAVAEILMVEPQLHQG